jgi:hypothetical protein
MLQGNQSAIKVIRGLVRLALPSVLPAFAFVGRLVMRGNTEWRAVPLRPVSEVHLMEELVPFQATGAIRNNVTSFQRVMLNQARIALLLAAALSGASKMALPDMAGKQLAFLWALDWQGLEKMPPIFGQGFASGSCHLVYAWPSPLS